MLCKTDVKPDQEVGDVDVMKSSSLIKQFKDHLPQLIDVIGLAVCIAQVAYSAQSLGLHSGCMAFTVVFSSLVQAADLLVPFDRRNNAFYFALAVPGTVSIVWYSKDVLLYLCGSGVLVGGLSTGRASWGGYCKYVIGGWWLNFVMTIYVYTMWGSVSLYRHMKRNTVATQNETPTDDDAKPS